MAGNRLTAWVGSMTSSVVRLFLAEKSLETIGAFILASGFVLLLCMGFYSGVYFERSRYDKFLWNGTEYEMTGLAEVPGNPGHYLPVYKLKGGNK